MGVGPAPPRFHPCPSRASIRADNARERRMPGQPIKIKSREGGDFVCYLALPAAPKEPVPAIVLASAIHGVDEDLRALADTFAAHGYIAAAPDLFWRSCPARCRAPTSARASARSRALERIKAGEADLADTLAELRRAEGFQRPRRGDRLLLRRRPTPSSGRSRLGFAAGISCHGTNLHRLYRRARRPDRAGLHHLGRRRTTPPRRRCWRPTARCRPHAQCRGAHLPRHQARLHDAAGGRSLRRKTREFSLARALAILDGLRGGGDALRRAS